MLECGHKMLLQRQEYDRYNAIMSNLVGLSNLVRIAPPNTRAIVLARTHYHNQSSLFLVELEGHDSY